MYLGEGKNDYGTPVSRFRCDHCGDEYTVCPVVPLERREHWNSCLSEACQSYDESRDADLLSEMDDPQIMRELIT